MRPLKLTMTAFGPYAASQTVDFSSLNEQGIFLVTGPTGAGKSSIFDAIAFALYGETSGSVRESGSLRSQYAAPSAICQVEYSFSLRGEEYTVRRQPRQQRQSRRGDAMTQLQEKAELILPDGQLLSGAKTVDTRLVELLGLPCTQFKQIAMLAQGEFRRLLDAPSGDKQEIFRRLFSTQFYDGIARRLEDQAKALENGAREQRQALEQYLAQAQLPDFSTGGDVLPQQRLTQQIALDRRNLAQLEQQSDALTKRRARLRPEEAEALNRQFEALSAGEQILARLNARQSEMEQSAAMLERYRATASLRAAAKNLQMANDAHLQAQSQRQQAQQNLLRAQKDLEDFASTLRQLPVWQEKAQQLNEQNERLLKLQEIARQRESLEQERKRAQDSLAQSQRRETVLRLLSRRAQLLKRQESVEKALESWESITRQQRQMLELAGSYREQKKRYLSAYGRFLDGQASILAGTLRENAPCPVCGSVHHPAPANAAQDIPTQQQVETLQAQNELLLEQGRRQAELLTDSLAQFSASLAAILEQPQAGITREMLGKNPALLSQQKAQLEDLSLSVHLSLEPVEQQLLALGGEKAMRDSRFSQLEELERQLQKALQDTARFQSAEQSLERQLSQLEERLSPRERDVTAAAASEQLHALRERQRQLERQCQQAQTDQARLSQQLHSAEQLLSMTCQQLEQTEKQLAPLENAFDALLAQNGYPDAAAFQAEQAGFSPDRMEQLAEQLTHFREELSRAKGETGALRQHLEGKQPADLAAIEIQAKQLDAQLSALRQQQIACSARLALNTQLQQQIAACQNKLSQLDADYAQIGELARIATGNNAQKLSFERYVLAAYFENVIQLANLRLDRMTGGRYALQRREEKERHGRASGLDLEVFDSYTGQQRHVSTLSGGESFQAALALALGLADVTSMFAGGISMDTIFIDEGFGSLDPAALDNAISALMALSNGENGRTVGVISHVEALKERIPHKIVVTPSHTGSTLEVL